MTMIALRHQKTHALVITDEANEQMFLEAGYIPVKGQDTEPAPSENKGKKSRSRKKKVAEDATDADGSM